MLAGESLTLSLTLKFASATCDVPKAVTGSMMNSPMPSVAMP